MSVEFPLLKPESEHDAIEIIVASWNRRTPEQAIDATLGSWNQAAMDKLKYVRETLESCRRTEEQGFDTYWITVEAMNAVLDELEQAIAATLGWIDEPDTIRNELADGGLIADALAPVCVDEEERRAFERGRVHERFAQQTFKEATS